MNHPTPWKVVYNQRFPTWHEKSSPSVVDANNEYIFCPPQSKDIGHPGEYDQLADETAHRIVNAVNTTEKTYWVVIDKEGPWITEDRPTDNDEIVLETKSKLEAEQCLCRQCSLYEGDGDNFEEEDHEWNEDEETDK